MFTPSSQVEDEIRCRLVSVIDLALVVFGYGVLREGRNGLLCSSV